MVGTPALAAFLAQAAFWVLLVGGVLFGALRLRAAIVFAALYAAGLLVLPFVTTYALFAPYVACVDIALVLAIFKGDVRLT